MCLQLDFLEITISPRCNTAQSRQSSWEGVILSIPFIYGANDEKLERNDLSSRIPIPCVHKYLDGVERFQRLICNSNS